MRRRGGWIRGKVGGAGGKRGEERKGGVLGKEDDGERRKRI